MLFFTKEQFTKSKEIVEKTISVVKKDLKKKELNNFIKEAYKGNERIFVSSFFFLYNALDEFNIPVEQILIFIGMKLDDSFQVDENNQNDLFLFVLSLYPMDFNNFYGYYFSQNNIEDVEGFKKMLLDKTPTMLSKCLFTDDLFYQKMFPQLRTNYYRNISGIKTHDFSQLDKHLKNV